MASEVDIKGTPSSLLNSTHLITNTTTNSQALYLKTHQSHILHNRF